MTNEQLRLQMLSGIITEGEYKSKLKENKSSKSKKPLNENFVGTQMVGNIFDREKTDYELAFEHFTKGSLSENEEVEEANLNEGALAIAGGIVLGALGLKAILGIMKGISSAVSLARMTDPKELKRSVEEIGKEAMQKGRNPLQIALWMMTVNSLIEKGEIKNGISLARTWGNIDKIDLEKTFSSSESGEVEEGKESNNY